MSFINCCHLVRNACLFAIIIGLTARQIAFSQNPEDQANSDSDIQLLIQQLDAPKYKLREQATGALTEKGRAALRPLAEHYFDATPEVIWRVKRILKKIGTESKNEETSLKAIGVLMILDNQLDQQLESLIESWRINRSTRTIEYLVSKGASTEQTRLNRQPNLVFPRQIIHFGGSVPQPANPLRKRNAPEPEPLSTRESKTQVKKIISGSFTDVQKLVLERIPPQQQDNQNQVLVNRGFINNATAAGIGASATNTFLEFGENWQGTAEDIERARDIHSLTAIRFSHQNFSPAELNTIAHLKNLRHVGISDSNIDSKSWVDIKIPPSVASVELAKLQIDAPIIDWLASRELTNILIHDCSFSNSAKRKFEDLSHLQSLNLTRVNIDDRLFQTLEKMGSLQRINISICKFSPNDYRAFERIRPKVVYFDPVSFLGVQGTRDSRRPEMFSCEIEMVVEGSGADKAGLLPGDVIKSVDGVPIHSFTELRMFISQHDVGEEMSFRVSRGKKELDLTAILGVNPRQISR